MRRACLGIVLATLVAVACATHDSLELEPFEVSDGVVLYSNDERQGSYEDWAGRLHFAVPSVEVPRGLTLVNAYSYRPDADLDLSLVSLFFEDAADPRRWLLVKFDDRAPFVVLAPAVTTSDVGAAAGRGGVYTSGGGERWHDLAFEACRLGVTVKGHADVWSRADVEAVARAIVEGCDDHRGPVGD